MRYVNGLKYSIQDEMSTHYFHTVDEAYQVSLKVEELVDKKMKQKLRGKGPRGRRRASTSRVTKNKMNPLIFQVTKEMELEVIEDSKEKGESM